MTINHALTDEAPASAGASGEVEQLAGEILQAIGAARAAASSEGFRGLVGRSLSMTHLHVLGTLRARDSMRMSDLARALDISVANATGIVTRMEDRGLVARSRDANDRRAVNASLTDEGRQVLVEMDRRGREFFTRVLGRLSVEELTELRNGMRAMFRAGGELAAEAKAHQSAEAAEERTQ